MPASIADLLLVRGTMAEAAQFNHGPAELTAVDERTRPSYFAWFLCLAESLVFCVLVRLVYSFGVPEVPI